MKNLKIDSLKAELCRLVAKRDWMPTKPFVERSRFFKWRGKAWEEGRFKATFRVPNEHVNDVPALSGKEGLVIDIPRKSVEEEDDEDLASEHARIRMAPDLTMQDV